MSSKSKSSFSAGHAGVTRANVNLKCGGGNRKGGLPPLTTAPCPWIQRALRLHAYPTRAQQQKVFRISQTNLIGRRMF